jgi:hypothetical protein
VRATTSVERQIHTHINKESPVILIYVGICNTSNVYSSKHGGDANISARIRQRSHKLCLSNNNNDNNYYYYNYESRNSVVGIATGYGLDHRGVGVRVRMGSRIFFFLRCTGWLGPTQPPIQWVMGTLSPEVKRQGREADHSPPSNAEVKKMWIYTSTTPYVFMALGLLS